MTRLNPAHRKAEVEYRNLHEKLALNMTRDEVEGIFTRLEPKYLYLMKNGRQEDWWIRTPFRFAENWVMDLNFEDDRLVRIHTRIVDYDEFPEGAPPDKMLSGFALEKLVTPGATNQNN